MTLKVSQRVIEATYKMLDEHRDKKKVVRLLVARKIPEAEAIKIVDAVHKSAKGAIRSRAAMKCVLGGLGLAVTGALAVGGIRFF